MKLSIKKKKVMLGLSGGVDSAVALYQLIKDGYDVIAVFMRNWDSALNRDILGNPTVDDEICPQERDYQDALKVAQKLGVTLERVDFVKEYWDRVFTYFLNEYKLNRTPNPDVLCNNEIKFKAFLDYAMAQDVDYIAMGHYARVLRDETGTKLLRGVDDNKDQSYFLSQLTSEQLSKALFPIGEMTKDEVRESAKKLGLSVSDKKDSTGICFIGERDFNKFLANYLPAKPGLMKRLDGTVIGNHYGLMNYTIGQRKGLGIGTIDGLDGPWFVVGKELETNTLLVENKDNLNYLKSDQAIITNYVWRGPKVDGIYTAKFRYRQKDVEVEVKFVDDNQFIVNYHNVTAVTPGQVCAIYSGEVCVGSGFIDQVYYQGEKRRYS
ncbi:MAG: tRNA 2-thiouridine(34) synthase MnmA [Acholeplasmataceae bacterium]|jgi:tRNA-specific 2-thiouridylase